MGRVVSRLVAAAGWTLLGALALLGVSLSALAGFSCSPPGRAWVAELLTRELHGLIAGRLTVDGVEVLPGGGLEVRRLQLRDPDGRLVLGVARAQIFADLTRLAQQEVGVAVQVDGPSILLVPSPDGDPSLARAVAPAHPAQIAGRPPGAAPGRRSWTIELSRLTVRGGDLRWLWRDGSTAAEATGIDAEAEGALGEAGGFVRLRLRAAVGAPVPGPLALDAAAAIRGGRLEVTVLDAALGDTRVEALGEGDLHTRAFRVAVTRLGVVAVDARRLGGAAASLGGDVVGKGYAESDGAIVSAALDAAPDGGGERAGTARAAVAVELAGAPAALGFDVALAAFDPSRLLAQAPRGRLDLVARGAAAGRGLSDGRGRIALELAPSRLRNAQLGPISLVGRAGEGVVVVERLEARLPGLAVSGRGRWRERGAVGGDVTVDASDLELLARNLGVLTGVAVPPLGGRLRARAALSGTGVAPSVTAKVDAPALSLGATRAEAVTLSLEAAGPMAAARIRLAARAARAVINGTEARGLELAAALAAGGDAVVSLTGAVPSVGPDPVALECAARLARDRRGADVRKLSIRWPGARFALARPAAVTFAPPAVDRLELLGRQGSVALSGGLGSRGELDVRVETVHLDLARLPPGLVPAEAGVVGELSLDARVTGATRTPGVAAHIELTDAGVRGLTGLQVLGDVRWNGRGRLTGDVGLLRTAGGSLHLAADLAVPLAAGRSKEPVALTVDAAEWPVEALRELASVAAPVTGTLGGRVALSGTAAAPRLDVALALDDAIVEDLGPLAAAVALESGSGVVRITAATKLAGAPLLDAAVRLPVDLVGLVRHPEATLRALAHAPISGALELAGVDLAKLAGKAGLPEGLAGTVSGTASLGGMPSALRGSGTLSVAGGAWGGYRDVAARVELTAEAERTAFTARASIGGAEALRADGALGAPVERLSDPAKLRAAQLTLEATVPPLPLARAAGGSTPIAGTLSGHLSAKGTLARLEARLDLGGKAVELEGRPLGDLAAVVRHEATTTTAELSLRPPSGGVLWAGGTLVAPHGLREPRALRQAAATLQIKSDALDLGFLPALVPGLVRSASGRLTIDLAASGPLGGLRPRGTVKLEGGRAAIATLGDWSGVELVATLGDRSMEVSRLEARHGAGRVSGRVSVHGLGTTVARGAGRLEFQRVTVTRDGEELATLDLPIELEASLGDRLLDATVTLAAGTIRLPLKPSRALQSVEKRSDIVEVEPEGRQVAVATAEAPKPLEVRCRLLIPGKLFVRSEYPAVNLELKGDSTWHLLAGELTVEGVVEVVRGTVEPISGRVFHVERGRVIFPGGGVKAAQLDVVARYDNPQAVVTVTIGETVARPSIRLSSTPSMDDASIAMLIATGRTEINLNTSGVNTVSSEEAGAAMVSAAVSAVFTGLVANKLPVDQISVETSRVRAGKYLTDKLFIGYAYSFDAKPEENENVNEVKAEYQIAPRWNFELRYGDAHAGDASVIWSKDY
ncbi:translocation/assembly module TamB domain-containing protein [Anaeromyxobacter oryzae]|uniref:Translocation and assembly module TamB C-terminal domain-containing protein n=1 Tax=Anaeromyxobacter oryzae TaxID=2918170 RepID=A0ABN6MZD3_9BACT|nr:translocation/assembly module TamB domain-containing protein [Anaeromyxobacter oryzae]BDG05620.1 hypothetical protein AMOR_46160 [Anaeromyxobacter oryzae]